MNNINFMKMDGLGNDFVIIDNRDNPFSLTDEQVRQIADRNNPKTGGCDQLILIENSEDADCFMRIYNSDGGEVDNCGNAARCIGKIISDEMDQNEVLIETAAGILNATRSDNGLITINMGAPKLDWQEIPLSHEVDTLHLPVEAGDLKDPVGVSMGNPHAVFFVEDNQAIDLEKLGPTLEHHELFPERANIGVASIIAPDQINLRVFERGAGETDACGTGACAALVAASRRDLSDRKAKIFVRGGELEIQWLESGDVLMTGPTNHQFNGTLDLS